MAERDRHSQRGEDRGGSYESGSQGRAGAFRGDDPQRGQRGGGGGGRSEFGGYGASGPGYGGRSSGGGGRGAGYGGQGGSSGQGGYGGYGGQSGQGGYGGPSGQGGQGSERGFGGGSSGDWRGRGMRDDDDGGSWMSSHSPSGGRSSGAERGQGEGARRWFDESSDQERWEAGGGTGYAGPSQLGWQTDAGYGAGATGYGGAGSGATGDWGSRYGAGAASRNRGPKGWQRSDDRIHDDVCERLAHESGIDPSDVTVEVRGGDVTLTGTVPDRGMKYRIEDIVDGCSGVRDVENRLRVGRGGLAGMLGGGAMGMGTTTDARGRRDTGSRDGGGSRGSLLGRLFGFSTGARLSDIMTRNPRTVTRDETLQKVAQVMKEEDVGAIPVCEGRKLVGMITDRDIVVRAAAGGKALEQTKVSEAMTTQVHSCYEDDEVEAALGKMGDLQVRRIPVLDRSDQLVGIVSLGDFAQRDTGDVEDTLQDISQPT